MDYTHSIVDTIEPGFYAFDMEYTSLKWDSTLKWGQFYDPNKNHVYLVRAENFKNIPWSELKVIGHYMQNDLALLTRDGYDLPEVVGCTWIMARILQVRNQGLKELVEAEFDHGMIHFDEEEWIQPDSWDEPDEEQFQYMCDDTVWQYRLWEKWSERYEKNYGKIFKMEARLSEMFAEMKAEGILVKEGWEATSLVIHRDLAKLEAKLSQMSGFAFRINSRADKLKVLVDEMHLEPLSKTDKGAASIDKAMLEHYADKGNEFVDILLEAVNLESIRKGFDGNKKGTSGFKTRIENDGRIHTSFLPVGYEGTSRIFSQPSTQSLPMKLREYMIPDEDRKFWYVDISGCELITMAREAGCKAIVDVYDRGDDVHIFVASKVLKCTIEEAIPKRDVSKIITFSIAFGSTGGAASRALGIPIEDGEDLVSIFYDVFPEMKTYMESRIKLLHETGCAFTVLGRIRRLPEINNPAANTAHVERQSICTAVQSSAADLVKLIMWRIRKNKPKTYKIVFTVFDSILFDVPGDAEWGEFAPIVEDAMTHLPKGHKFRFKVGVSTESWAAAQAAA